MTDNQTTEEKASSTRKIKSIKPWYLRPLTLSISGMVLVLIVLGASGAIYLNQRNQQLALQKELQNLKVTVNPVAKMDLSLDEIRGLATTKLNTITGGIPLDQIQSSLAKTPLTSNRMSPTGSGGDPSNSTAAADTITPAALFKEKNIDNIADKTVYYTEDVTTELEEGFSYSYLNSNPNYNKKKPVKTQSWISTNYSKYVLSQDDKIISYNIYSLNYSVDYRGGKFAIKENFDNSQYFSGLSAPIAGTVDNSEIGWLKSLLSDKSLKDEGTIKIDGRNHKILATDPNFNFDTNSEMVPVEPVTDQFITKYYIDITGFGLYKTESYIGKTLKSQTVRSGHQEIINPDLNDLFSAKDLKNIPIKEVQGFVTSITETSAVNFISKYKILIPTELSSKTNNLYAYDSSLYNESEIAKLRNSIDFDPIADPNYLESTKNSTLANFTIHGISGNIYKSYPNESKNLITLAESKFKINGKTITGNLRSYNYDQEDLGDKRSKIPQYYDLDFIDPETNLIYILSEYIDPNAPNFKSFLSNKDLNFSTFDSQAAKNFDAYQKARIESYPQLMEAKFDEIKAGDRLLPGDLLKEYKIKAAYLSKSTRTAGDSSCDKYLDSITTMESCFIDKYNGFTLSYNEDKSDSDNATYLSYTLLNTKFEDLDLKLLTDKIKENSEADLKINIEKKDNYGTIYFKDPYNPEINVFFFKLKNKTILLNTNLDKIKVTKIALQVELDKDLAVLASQLEKSKLVSNLEYCGTGNCR